jgi:chromosome segregation ATPase
MPRVFSVWRVARRAGRLVRMTIHVPRRLAALLVVAAAVASGPACDALYYKTMRTIGREKRDILVNRVKDARKSQDEAQREFKSALERFQAIVEVEGGSLEDKYEKLNDELQRSEDRANTVKERIKAVREVSEDLFDEWDDELGKYSDRELRRESQRQLRDTKRRTDALIASMTKAQERVEPVLKPLRDRVLFLRHNLNARALGALTQELDTVRTGVDALIADLQRSIADADAFIAEMEKAEGPEGS